MVLAGSYVDENDADILLGDDVRPEVQAFLLLDDYTSYLIRATMAIDNLKLRGQRYESKYLENGVQRDLNSDGISQALEFPRIIDGIVVEWDYGLNLPIVPDLVQWACLEEAVAIYKLENDPMDSYVRKAQDRGAVSASVAGEGSESWLPGASNKGLYSPIATRLMARYVGGKVR